MVTLGLEMHNPIHAQSEQIVISSAVVGERSCERHSREPVPGSFRPEREIGVRRPIPAHRGLVVVACGAGARRFDRADPHTVRIIKPFEPSGRGAVCRFRPALLASILTRSASETSTFVLAGALGNDEKL